MASLLNPQSSFQLFQENKNKNPEENTLKITLGQNSPYTDAKGRQIPSKKENQLPVSLMNTLTETNKIPPEYPLLRFLLPPSLSLLYFSELHLLGSSLATSTTPHTNTAPGRSRSHASHPGHALHSATSRLFFASLRDRRARAATVTATTLRGEVPGVIRQPIPESVKRGLHNEPSFAPDSSSTLSTGTSAGRAAQRPELRRGRLTQSSAAQVALMEWDAQAIGHVPQNLQSLRQVLASSVIAAPASASAIKLRTSPSEKQMQGVCCAGTNALLLRARLSAACSLRARSLCALSSLPRRPVAPSNPWILNICHSYIAHYSR